MTLHLSSSELAAEQLPGLPSSPRKIRERADRQGWPFTEERRQGGLVRLFAVDALPAEARRILLERRRIDEVAPPSSGVRIAAPNLDTMPDRIRQIAVERARLVGRVHELVAAGTRRLQATELAAGEWSLSADDKPSGRTVRRWVATCAKHARGDWFALLVPEWRSSSAQAECHPDAWAFFCDDYARGARPSYTACYRRTLAVAEKRGWLPVPTCKTMMRRHQAEVPRATVLLAREGAEELGRRFPAQERDRTTLAAMQAWNADGHKWDVTVAWPDGTEGRPIAVVFQDLASGKILSWRIDRTESADLVRLAAADALSTFGVPDSIYLDNGRGFASKWMTGGMQHRFRFRVREEEPTGVFTQLGIAVHWTTPYHGQAKPIERAFRDLCETVAKHPAFAGAYTGNSPTTKPHDYGSRAVPLDQFLRVLAALIKEHNARVGRRAKACAGRSFDETFRASYEAREIRKLTEDQKRVALLAADAVAVRRGTADVFLAGNRYWSDALVALEGQRVVVRFDPDNLRAGVHVFRLDGRYVTFAKAIDAVGFADMSAAKDHVRAHKQYVRAIKDAEKGRRRFAADELGEMHLDAIGAAPLPPKAKVVRPLFGKATPKAPPPVPMQTTEHEIARLAEADEVVSLAGAAALASLRRK